MTCAAPVASRKKAAPRRTSRRRPSTVTSAGILKPAGFESLIKQQAALPFGSVLDHVCLTADRKHSLGGVPRGCTIALTGPLAQGKTRTVLAGLARAASSGMRVGLVVSEEKFRDAADSGRDDLCSRMTKIGMAATGLSESEFRDRVLSNTRVLEVPAYENATWEEFLSRYRALLETEAVELVVIDSLALLNPSHPDVARHVAALRSCNHQHSVTCICVSQFQNVSDAHSLSRVADALFVIEPMSLDTKEIAELWGGRLNGRIDIIRALRCVTAPEFPHPIRLKRDEVTGEFLVHDAQPGIYAVPTVAPAQPE